MLFKSVSKCSQDSSEQANNKEQFETELTENKNSSFKQLTNTCRKLELKHNKNGLYLDHWATAINNLNSGINKTEKKASDEMAK